MVDAHLLARLDEGVYSAELILGELLSHRFITECRYADVGPPAGTPSKRSQTGAEACIGWAVVTSEADEQGIQSIVYADEKQFFVTGTFGNRTEIAQHDMSGTSYDELGPCQAGEQRRLDAVAGQVAEAWGADIFVTERPYLFESRIDFAQGTTILRPVDALPVVALYLRAQAVYMIQCGLNGHDTLTTSKGGFYLIGAHELLPASWRWYAACAKEVLIGKGDDRLLYLAQSLLQRVQHALEARDAVHCTLNRPQNNDSTNTALSDLNTVAILLMGAVDAAARVAHLTLKMPENKLRRASWQERQNKGWLEQVRGLSAALADTVSNGADGEHVLTVLRSVRNSVHGEALQGLTINGIGGHVATTLIGLPREDISEVMTALTALGGSAAWGVQRKTAHELFVEPGVFLEQLFPRVLTLLNLMMEKTPVENLPNYNLTLADTLPPTDPMGMFSELNRLSIRWQLGF
ncbi:hypothetical protein [Amycolatopsis sp. NBC_01480]|uniref:hypothetical protein n=1 Tax=Amycolatopsis sp. NBC_01480 TaxID=2903562 RepID=UPI002E2DAB82|nr:hypothetical protein [Amycolatopsis sp. NBC_01480]